MKNPIFHFPPLGEFKFVENLLKNGVPLEECPPANRNWLSAGDDAAIFDGWLATKDLSVEGVHFRLDWSSPEQAVEKHIVSNVSDICSMGGEPRLALFGICVGKNWSEETKKRIVSAVSKGFASRGIAVIGGDTVGGCVGMFSTTLLGVQRGEKPLLRSGAVPGDKVYVSGSLGKSAAGLYVLENHPEDVPRFSDLVEYHLCPKIDENMGKKLVDWGVTGGCIDISDGLSSELNHLALSSGVQIEIDENLLPVDAKVQEMADYYGISALNLAMNGGEEYQLLFSSSCLDSIFQDEDSRPSGVYPIGVVKQGSSVWMNIMDGSRKMVNAQAWSHLC
ncbi:MAG: thiamine-phosphate kinase [Fibrobacteraceae bacterium]|nr:thiamine-phosphate kinase [Fibrobacteraceae bacterium]